MLSVIPDIHADADRLRRTLAMVDPADGIIFLGDLIDAGAGVAKPSDCGVLEAAHGMIASGRALGIMGNHELNAILFHRQGPGGPLRAHSDKNRHQHKASSGHSALPLPRPRDGRTGSSRRCRSGGRSMACALRMRIGGKSRSG